MSDNLPATQQTMLSAEELMDILAKVGAVDEKREGYGAIRMKVTGNIFQTDDDVWMSNPKTNEPAFVARLLGPPEQYQAFWFDKARAERAGRPEMADRFCRSRYDHPDEAREYGTNGAPCRSCIFKPWGEERQHCAWKGDLRFQMVKEDGVMTGDEPVYEISLSTTSMVEWRGAGKDRKKGSATDKTFVLKLGDFMQNLAAEWEVSPQEAVELGWVALNEGLVAAEFRIVQQTNEELGRTWSVVSLTPVFVQRPEVNTTQLTTGEEEEEVIEGEVSPEAPDSTDLDSLPF